MSRRSEAMALVLDNLKGELLRKIKDRKKLKSQPAPEPAEEPEPGGAEDEEE